MGQCFRRGASGMGCLHSMMSGASTEETNTRMTETARTGRAWPGESPSKWLLHSHVWYLGWASQRLDSDRTDNRCVHTCGFSMQLWLFTAWRASISRELSGSCMAFYDLACCRSHAVSLPQCSVSQNSHRIQGEDTQSPTLNGRSIKEFAAIFLKLSCWLRWGFFATYIPNWYNRWHKIT